MASSKLTKTKSLQKSYKYDVAFSFLSEDEALATEINDLLQDRMKTFIYSKRQGEIAGTDGEKTFNRVFGQESRTVVVLYRSGWGNTAWTRIEETAIKNRGYDHGYDFLILIPLDEPPASPEWLPKPRLWINIKRWGPSGAASVIEARVHEQGGEAREETVQQRAARFERSLKFAERRKQFHYSYDGVNAAKKEFEFLGKELQRLVKEIENYIHIDIKIAENQIVILGVGFLCLNLYWKINCANSLEDAFLYLDFWEGHPPFPGKMNHFSRKLKSLKFQFYLTPSETYMWNQFGYNKEYNTVDLSSFILRTYMDEEENRNIRKK